MSSATEATPDTLDSTATKDTSQETSKAPKSPGLFRGYGDGRLFGMRVGAVLLTSVSQPFLSAPFNWWPWHWIAWIPFLWAIFAQEGKGRMWLGLLGGTAANYMIFYWIVNLMPAFSNIPVSVSIILNLLLCMWLAVIWVMLAWLLPKVRAAAPDFWVLIGPALLVALEYATPQLFPYMQGVSHYQVTPIFLISSITGVYGVSFLVFWSNCTLFHILVKRREGKSWPRWMLPALGVTVALVLVYGVSRQYHYKQAARSAKKLKIGLIQSNFLPSDHSKLKFPTPFQTYLKLSKEAVKKGAQWVVWSEGEYKYPLSYSGAKKELKKAATEIGVPILFGALDIRKVGKYNRYTNSATHYHPKTGFGTIHDKVILVPFGEYMPFQDTLGFIYKHINWQSRYLGGKHVKVGRLHGIPYGFLICYEAIYPSLVRDSVRRGSRLLVNITYDAWFGKTTAPYQHLMLAASRSAETGVPMARLATTGATTVVNALGQMDKLSQLFKRQVLIYEIPLVYMPSIYTRIGDVFAATCTLIVLLTLLLAWVDRLTAEVA